MKIGVIGAGYVGLVTGACLAEYGNDVTVTDRDQRRLTSISRCNIPFYEPGLEELVIKGLESKRLRFSDSTTDVVRQSEIIFLAVGTPQSKNSNEVDLTQVMEAAQEIGRALATTQGSKVIAVKSTVLPGTTRRIQSAIDAYSQQVADADPTREVDTDTVYTNVSNIVVSNPEFLREGSAIEDFTKPDRVIVGTNNQEAAELLRKLYSPFMRKRERFLVIGQEDAELAKYAANAFLATRITFMNDLAGLAEKIGSVDIEKVRESLGYDPRIGPSYLFPGPGYGGSCFPKDVKALLALAVGVGFPLSVLESVDLSNETHKYWLADTAADHFKDSLARKIITLWGLAFKPKTDDIRESPSIHTVERLLGFGATVRAYDPEPRARENFRARFEDKVVYYKSLEESLEGADALLIATDAHEFRGIDPQIFNSKLGNPTVVIDSRNLYDLESMQRHNIRYISRGRPVVHVSL